MTAIYIIVGALLAAGLIIWRERRKEKLKRTFYVKKDDFDKWGYV